METVRALWGKRISAARQALEMTQGQLAAAMGVTQQLVSAWEQGKAAPGQGRRPRLAQILGVRIDDLFAYPDSNGDDEAAA